MAINDANAELPITDQHDQSQSNYGIGPINSTTLPQHPPPGSAPLTSKPARKGQKRIDRRNLDSVDGIIDAMAEIEAKKIALGDGLEACIADKSAVTFHFRITQNKKCVSLKLGCSTTMSLPQAREAARGLHQKARDQREKKSAWRFDNAIAFVAPKHEESDSKRVQKKHLSFRSIDDAALFLATLTYRPETHSSPPMREALFFVQMQVLFPATFDELINAQWNDFDGFTASQHSSSLMGWTIPQKQKTDGKQQEEAKIGLRFLNKHAQMLLDHYHKDQTCNREIDTFLFHHLRSMDQAQSKESISEITRDYWCEYSVRPDHTKHFLAEIAQKHGLFSEKVVNASLSGNIPKRTTNDSDYHSFFILQAKQLSEWWGFLLKEQSRWL